MAHQLQAEFLMVRDKPNLTDREGVCGLWPSTSAPNALHCPQAWRASGETNRLFIALSCASAATFAPHRRFCIPYRLPLTSRNRMIHEARLSYTTQTFIILTSTPRTHPLPRQPEHPPANWEMMGSFVEGKHEGKRAAGRQNQTNGWYSCVHSSGCTFPSGGIAVAMPC